MNIIPDHRELVIEVLLRPERCYSAQKSGE